MKSLLRAKVIGLSKILIRDELLRKRCIVSYYNAKASISDLGKRSSRGFDMFNPTNESLKNVFRIDEFYRGNGLYGIGKSLRDYSGFERKLPVCIEHGLYFGNYVDENIVDGSLPGIVTFSEPRQFAIREQSGRDAMPIGPYIHYADPFLSPDHFEKNKERLGKTLLVFPAHSIEEANSNRSDATLLEQAIENLEKKYHFESVLICLYYNDFIQNRRFSIDRPVTFVCAGHRFDPSFLARLKSLIMLADYTLSDDIGTHVGYCVSMGKPHTVVLPDERRKAFYYAPELKEIADAFIQTGPLDAKRVSIAEKYWGLSLVRSPEFLFDYFVSCELKLKGQCK